MLRQLRFLLLLFSSTLGLTGIGVAPASAQMLLWYSYFMPTRSDIPSTFVKLTVGPGVTEPVGSPRPIDPGQSGYMTSFHRLHGPEWSGESGLYFEMYLPLFVPPQSQTWDGIYAWAQGAGVPAGLVQYSFYGIGSHLGPGASAELVLDCVPAELDYAGPWKFPIDVYSPRGTLFDIPVPNVTDPLLGTRMHITVTMVPEPSSLLALSAGLAGMAGVWRARFARRPRHQRRGEG